MKDHVQCSAAFGPKEGSPEEETGMLDNKVKELIAVGASVAANCHPCVKYHVGKAREMKVAEDQIRQAIEVGQMVRKGAAGQMDGLIEELKK